MNPVEPPPPSNSTVRANSPTRYFQVFDRFLRGVPEASASPRRRFSLDTSAGDSHVSPWSRQTGRCRCRLTGQNGRAGLKSDTLGFTLQYLDHCAAVWVGNHWRFPRVLLSAHLQIRARSFLELLKKKRQQLLFVSVFRNQHCWVCSVGWPECAN